MALHNHLAAQIRGLLTAGSHQTFNTGLKNSDHKRSPQETTQVTVTNDFLTASDSEVVYACRARSQSSVDHNILLVRLKHVISIKCTVV